VALRWAKPPSAHRPDRERIRRDARRELSGSALSRQQWVTLTVVVMSGGSTSRSKLIERVTGALKIGAYAVEHDIAGLAAQAARTGFAAARAVLPMCVSVAAKVMTS
jgi:hypothetical protein